VSAIEPPFAASVFARTPVGTPTTEAVIVSPHVSAAVDADVAESTVISILTSAAVVEESPPTTVTEVAPVGPTATFIDVAATAFAGTTAEVNPIPNAETATSAMRLSVVFVDIDFLSLVVKKTFSFTAGKERLFTS
jgi:hypothetical protein